MGTSLFLYQAPNAQHIVLELNLRNRLWASDEQEYHAKTKELDIQEDTLMPKGVQEVVFESKKHPDLFPTQSKVHALDAYLDSKHLTPLHAIFGFDSAEPKDLFLCPDWHKSWNGLERVLEEMTPGPSNGKFTHRQHMEAFEEMVAWVIDQTDFSDYFLKWSW